MVKRIMTPESIAEAFDLRLAGKNWDEIGRDFGCSAATARRHCSRVAKRDPRLRLIFDATAQRDMVAGSIRGQAIGLAKRAEKKAVVRDRESFIFAPVPETRDNELTGTPPLCRSALNEVETDGRGNIAKPAPVRINVGAINIPDIRIGAGHQT